ncbi:MAG: hypothetical protein HYZ57_04115 [Acidobacteria bacterium]|nr:hypothetical protein [Acidobacteriota bacterium]
MKIFSASLVLAILTLCPLSGQPLLVETDTMEGQLLQQIDVEQNAAKKIELLELFAKRFPNHEAITWVLSHIQVHSLAEKQYDRAIETGKKILSIDPDEVAAAHNALKAAEGMKDVDLIQHWSGEASRISRKVASLPKPEEPEEQEAWKIRTEYARQVEAYAEYALYFAAANSKDARLKARLIEALEQRNPKSEYLALMRTAESAAVRQVDIVEAVAAAETAFNKGEYRIDALLMAATYYMERQQEPDKVISYSLKLIHILASAPAPREMSAAGWESKKSTILGRAHWMAGLLYSVQGKYSLADKHLRASLPLLHAADMIAGALYHLGYVNFRIAEGGERIRIHDAVRFTGECVKIPSAIQAQAVENLRAMKAEYNLPD